MKSKLLLLGMSGLALTWGTGFAEAGVIRATAKGIGEGSATIVRSTPDAASDAAGGLATAGKATGGAVKTGATSVGKGVTAAPGLAGRGTVGAAKAAKAIWKAAW